MKRKTQNSKLKTLAAGLVMVLAAGLLMGGCQTATVPTVTPAQLQQLNESVTAAQAVSAELKAAVAQTKATAATQPGGEQVAATLAPVEKAQARIDSAIASAAPIVAAAATASAQPQADALSVAAAAMTAAAPLLPPPYGAYVSLGLLAASLIANVVLQIKNKNTAAAASANTDAISAAIANKQITIAPNAPLAIDAVVTDHPIGDRLVDVVTAGAATKP